MALRLEDVKKYWEENLPEASRRLKAKGRFEERLELAIDHAEDYLADLVESGLYSESRAEEVAHRIAFPAPEAKVPEKEAGPEDDEEFDYDTAEETVAFVCGDRSMPVMALVDKDGRAKLINSSPQPLSQPSASSAPEERHAPHWAIEVLLQPELDLDQVVRDVESEGLPEWVESAYQALDYVTSGGGQLPTWLPDWWENNELSPDQRLAWFDELMQSYYRRSVPWPPASNPNTTPQLVIRCLLLMYHDRATGNLPAPSFIEGR